MSKQTFTLDDDERRRMLELFDRALTTLPDRPRAELDAELTEVRRARRGARRDHPPAPPRP